MRREAKGKQRKRRPPLPPFDVIAARDQKSILTPLSLSLSTSLAHCVVLPQRSTPSSTMKAPLGEDDEEDEVDAARRGSEEAMEPTFAFVVAAVAAPAPAAPAPLLIPAISAGGGPGIRRALDVTEERACAREKRRRREAMVAMMLSSEGKASRKRISQKTMKISFQRKKSEAKVPFFPLLCTSVAFSSSCRKQNSLGEKSYLIPP